MRIVVDTNVLISGVFFGGFPRKILSSIVNGKQKISVKNIYLINSGQYGRCTEMSVEIASIGLY